MRLGDLPRVFLGSAAVGEGQLTRKQLRGPSVRRVLQGVYAPATVADSHGLRVEAAGLVLPPRALVSGRSACTALGVPLATTTDRVYVLVPEHSPLGRSRGLDIVRLTRMPAPGRVWRGVQLAPDWRIAVDLAARQPLPTAVAHLDAAVRAGALDPVAADRGLRVARCHFRNAAREALALTDPRAQSQPESVVRVVLVKAGIGVEPQVEIRTSDGRHLVVDLAVTGHRVAVEYDGGWHVLREQLERDRWRLNELRAAGWDVVHVTARMLRDHREIVARVRAAILRVGGTPSH